MWSMWEIWTNVINVDNVDNMNNVDNVYNLDNLNNVDNLDNVDNEDNVDNMDNVIYNDLKLLNTLLTVEESKMILTWRLRMARFGKNYGENLKPCPLCKFDSDSQEKCYKECIEINKYGDTTM